MTGARSSVSTWVQIAAVARSNGRGASARGGRLRRPAGGASRCRDAAYGARRGCRCRRPCRSSARGPGLPVNSMLGDAHRRCSPTVMVPGRPARPCLEGAASGGSCDGQGCAGPGAGLALSPHRYVGFVSCAALAELSAPRRPAPAGGGRGSSSAAGHGPQSGTVARSPPPPPPGSWPASLMRATGCPTFVLPVAFVALEWLRILSRARAHGLNMRRDGGLRNRSLLERSFGSLVLASRKSFEPGLAPFGGAVSWF
jgi:hypothetical protein